MRAGDGAGSAPRLEIGAADRGGEAGRGPNVDCSDWRRRRAVPPQGSGEEGGSSGGDEYGLGDGAAGEFAAGIDVV